MRRHVLSTLGDLDLDTRMAAEAAARRAGLSLEDWAATILTGQAEASSPNPARRQSGEDLDSIIARMSKTARRQPRSDYDTLMEAAAAQTERHTQDQASRTAIALESMASWIEHAEERLNQTARATADHQDRMASALAQALSALKDRLDAVERHTTAERAMPARIEFPIQDAVKALNPLSETLVGLRTDMARLTERLEQPLNPGLAPAVEGIREDIERLQSSMDGLATRDEITTLDHAVRDIAKSIAKDLEQGRPGKDLLTLANSIAVLYRQIQTLSEEVSEGLHKRVGAELDHIKGRVDALAKTSVDRSVIDFLSSQIVDMRQDLAHRAEPHLIERLSGEVASLGQQIAELRAHQLERSDFTSLKSSLENVCSALSRTVAAQEASSVPEQLQDLSRRLDILASRPEPEPANLDPIAEQLALLTERMAVLTDSRMEQADTLTASIERLSSQVQSLTDAPASSREPILSRFDRIEEELRQVGQQADTSSIELMLRTIGTKLENAPSASAFEGLERRIMELAEQFRQRSSEPLHPVIGDAANHLRSLQHEAESIAERAAKAALNEIQVKAPDFSDLDALKQGFVELKALQTRSDKKTQQTLRAVHDALETLVARFPGATANAASIAAESPSTPSISSDLMPPADRLEAAVRRLHAAALSQIEEVSAAPREAAKTSALETVSRDGATPISSAPVSAPSPELGHVRASFIAAARRAAQTTAQEKTDASTPPLPQKEATHQGEQVEGGKADEASLAAPSLIDRIRRSFEAHRRPLLFGLAFLILAAGTAQILSETSASKATAAASSEAIQSVEFGQLQAVRKDVEVSSASPAPPQAERNALFQPTSLSTEAFVAVKFTVDPDTIGEIPLQAPIALRQAAQSGDAVAIHEIATRAAEGRGLPQDTTLAARLYERAAQAGFAPAQERLAMLYEKGVGIGRDTRLAVSWYERAAHGGNVRAMHNLATLLASGVNGKPDYTAALRWYTEAAEAGVRDSQFNMGVLLARGIGAKQDLAKAYKWFAIAAAQGDTEAARKRDEVGIRLGAADLAAAKTSAGNWQPRAVDPLANEKTPVAEGQTAALGQASGSRS